MRPKILHYCWFGNQAMPEKELSCTSTWKKLLPDWEFKLWNEQTYDLNGSVFARQAYDKKMFAFVSDCVRAEVLYRFGGLYLDTDVELYPQFRAILGSCRNFVGFETKRQVGTAVMAFEPRHSVIKELCECYSGDFTRNGKMAIEANVAYLTEILQKRGLLLNRETQQIDDVMVFDREYFFPKRLDDDKFNITEKTVAIHRCSGSWMSERQRKRGKNFLWVKVMRPILLGMKAALKTLIGSDRTKKIENSIRNILR